MVQALGSIYAVYLLLIANRITKLSSFSEIGFACFGTASIYVINIVVAVATVGMPIAYFMIFGDIARPILVDIGISETSFFSSEAFAKIVIAVLLYFFII